MRVQLISTNNGLGLTKDVEILRSLLVAISGEHMEVVFTDWRDITRQTPKKYYDHNIFLELVNPAFFPEAHSNIMVPNPEWFMREWMPSIKAFDQVWAKTKDAERIFRGLHKNVVPMGWTSPDRMDASVERKKALLHVAGGSSAKGTAQVLDAMRSLPKYHLTMVARKPWANVPRNVTVVERMTDAELIEAMNAHMIHLCPSSYEGFGHYINEARSVGAVVITTAAEPMTDLVTSATGFGASVGLVTVQNLAQHKHVDASSLAVCIAAAMEAPEAILAKIGGRARRAYDADYEAFTHNLIKALS